MRRKVRQACDVVAPPISEILRIRRYATADVKRRFRMVVNQMSFEPIASPATRILAGLAKKIAENQTKATASADKIGTAEHHKTLGAVHELRAEQAQWLAGKEAAWERLIETGFVK